MALSVADRRSLFSNRARIMCFTSAADISAASGPSVHRSAISCSLACSRNLQSTTVSSAYCLSILLLVCVSRAIIGQPCLHLQSVAEISRHSVLTMWDIVWVSPQGHSVCKSPFPSAGTTVSLFRAKTVQQRPLLPREVETRLPDCGVTH